MRLAKYLAHAGVASRRAAERIVADRRVAVDGAVVTDPARDVSAADRVTVDGAEIGGVEPRVVYALNKPAGVVSTARDPQGRPTVTALVPSDARLYPVGRLDVDVTGLLLLTNDGELANRLSHPRFEVDRTYRATVGSGPVREPALRALREGIELDDGPTAPARVTLLGPSRLELVLHEGRNRQVRRMLEAVGHPVVRLRRARYAGLGPGRLKPGDWRELTRDEVRRLRRLVGLS